MTTTPNELHAIKASVSATIARYLEEELTVAVGGRILAAIDEAAAEAVSRRVIMFDAETGDELLPSEAATGAARSKMAASCMPGWPIEELEKAYSAWLEGDVSPEPFAVGRAVSHTAAPTIRGRVTERVEEAGELHTVWVSWYTPLTGSYIAAQAYSPRELTEVAA